MTFFALSTAMQGGRSYVRDGRIIGVQLAGDITSAGVYHSLMLKRADIRDYET